MANNNWLDQLREIDFAELEFNTIGVWPLPVRIGLLTLVFVLVLGAAYYVHIKDMGTRLDRMQREEVTLRNAFAEKAFESANIEAYRAQMVELEKSFDALLAQLPSDTEVPGLLEDITEVGYGSSLEIDSITLQPEVASEFYVELPIRIVAHGGYHDFGTFVSGVSGLPRIVTLQDYSIITDEKTQR
ncbi:MAG: type 4a pilus biogenesis protein PilO, partial [Bacteroidales bacterium]|nr:type 4a pilus biogenesis protein PilO [Bacteroidales bacterium]